jgi:3-phytase
MLSPSIINSQPGPVSASWFVQALQVIYTPKMLLKQTLVTGIALCSSITSAAKSVDVKISAQTDEVEASYSAVYYDEDQEVPLLVGNDGSAPTGGFRTWDLLDGGDKLPEIASQTPGRTKVVGVLYGVSGKDLIVSIEAPDSVIRLFDATADDASEIPSGDKKMLGDWSSLCPWRSEESGWQYFYLFGKKEAVQFVVREKDDQFEVLEVSYPCHEYHERIETLP